MRGRLGRTWRRLGTHGATWHAPRTVTVFFALAFVAFTCVFTYLPFINNPNENVRTYMTMALVEEHTLRIDKIVERFGWVNDMARAPDKKTGEFHLYSVKAPAVSYAGVPVYWLFWKLAPHFGHPVPDARSSAEQHLWWFRNATLVLRLFTVELPCFAFLVWFERWLRRTTTRDTVLRLSAVAAAGLGTNYLAYSNMFASHAPFAIAAFGSFAVTTEERARFPNDPRKRRLSRAFVAGLLAGLATLLEYHALPVSVGLALYALTAFRRPTRLLSFGLGAAVCAGVLMLFQWRAYGNPLTPGHKMSENPAFAAALSQGLYGIRLPSASVFRDISVSRTYGFFGTSPFMWLGLLAIPFALFRSYGTRRERRLRRTATLGWLLIMLLLFLTVSAAINWRGGWTVGPRYLGAAPPFFAFGALCALEKIGRRSRTLRLFARALAGGAAIASVVQTGVVSLMLNAIQETVTRPLPQLVIPLARTGFVPHHAAELFGWMAPTFWYFVLACLLLAALVAAFGPGDDRIVPWLLRFPIAGVVACLAVWPAFSPPPPDEPLDKGAIPFFQQIWDPPNRDFIHRTREEAERYGTRRPCLWYHLADLERISQLDAQAAMDERRAGAPRSVCK